MQSTSDDQWFEQLDGLAKDRVRRIVEYRSRRSGGRQEALGIARADARGEHAQLAFEDFCTFLDADWCLADKNDDLGRMLEALLEEEPWDTEGDVPARYARAREGVKRMSAGPASNEDIFALAWVVAYRQSARLAAVVFDYQPSAGPGWRLVETWDGEETGRPLSSMVLVEARDRADRSRWASMNTRIPRS